MTGPAAFAVVLLLAGSTAAAEIPVNERKSSYDFMSRESRAMQDDDAANPATLSILDGETFDHLWGELAPVPQANVHVVGESVLGLECFPTPGHASQPGTWYGGTSPQGLFRSDDGGANWRGVDGFNEHPQRKAWCGGDKDGTPDGPKLHSILIDPRNAAHMYFGMSSGGVFESTDAGADWRPLNRGVRADFLPDPNAEYGHDPHCVRLHPMLPDRLYQQNHTGIYRLDRPAEQWHDLGATMPKSVGSIGFPVVLHPRDPDTLWVFPMDGSSVWPRVSPGGKPAVYRSVNGGKSWQLLGKDYTAIGIFDSKAYVASKGKGILRSTDGGVSAGTWGLSSDYPVASYDTH